MKYSGDLKSGLVGFWMVKKGWVANGPELNGIWNPEAQPFEIQTNGCHFVKKHFKCGQKGPDFEWSGFQMVGTVAMATNKARPFEYQTIWITDHMKSDLQKVWISNGQISVPHCTLIDCNSFFIL